MKKPWQIIFTQSLICHCSLSGSHHVVTQGERKPHSLLDTNTVTLQPQRREAPGGATLWNYTSPCLWWALFSALNMTAPQNTAPCPLLIYFLPETVLLKGFTLESIRDDLAKMQIVIF